MFDTWESAKKKKKNKKSPPQHHTQYCIIEKLYYIAKKKKTEKCTTKIDQKFIRTSFFLLSWHSILINYVQIKYIQMYAFYPYVCTTMSI